MLVLWRSSGYLGVVHDREDLFSINSLTLHSFCPLKIFSRWETAFKQWSKEHRRNFSYTMLQEKFQKVGDSSGLHSPLDQFGKVGFLHRKRRLLKKIEKKDCIYCMSWPIWKQYLLWPIMCVQKLWKSLKNGDKEIMCLLWALETYLLFVVSCVDGIVSM